jgi:hypothetical protein
MIFPDDLPHILEYRVGDTIRATLPRRHVEYVSSSGDTNANEICPQIPFGADAVRRIGGPWRKLSALPKAWLPFLYRQRPSEMDPRPMRKVK